MTSLGFPGPGLSEEQWSQLNALSIKLKPGQAAWLSGFFAGVEHQARVANGGTDTLLLGGEPAVSAPDLTAPARPLTVLFGSETGNCRDLAKRLSEALRGRGVDAKLVDMADYKPRALKDERDLLIIASTHGEGDPPLSAISFFEFVESRKAPRLEDTRFAVLALGDSTYEQFCRAGERLDQRLADLGAQRLLDRIDCDVDYDEAAAGWIDAALDAFASETAAGPSPQRQGMPASVAPTLASAFDKRNPFAATVIDNFALTGRGSSKETRHVELSLAGSNLTFQPGDALGILPQNDPALVEAILTSLSLSPDAPVVVKERNLTLREALSTAFEITAATPRFLDRWAELSGSAELAALRGEAQGEMRAAFLRSHHIVDIIRKFPVPGVDATAFIAALRPLQPRLYSLASSLTFAPDEAHITVSTVRYDLHGEARGGVASVQLAERSEAETTLPVYIQENPHFRLPENDAPIIMIGAGTGVAPYRAFLQEREALGRGGRAWLIFGERNFDSDFLYQTEWQGWLKEGLLTQMSVAFSRDQANKIYVQDRLRESARDVYAWLEEGAHLYLCGDGTNLAPAIQSTLSAIVQEQGGLSREAANDYLGALQRDHRYQIDVY